MMYKTIYRFRVLVEEKAISFPLHLCIYQNKSPQFDDLFDKIRKATQHQGLDINDYSITAFNNRNQHRFLLHDDLSLDDALRSMSDSHYLELVLQRKRARTLSPPGHLFRRESTMEPMPFSRHLSCDVPVIKPTVLRWSPTNHPDRRTSHPLFPFGIRNHEEDRTSMDEPLSMEVEGDEHSCSIRKDSGISLDEPIDDKKQQSMPIDQMRTRKLPDLYYSPPPPLLQQQQHRPSVFEPAPQPFIHPLDFRRSSTAPPSPPPFASLPAPVAPIKLPAISSITSTTDSHDSAQLAPIFPFTAEKGTPSPPHRPRSSSSQTIAPPPPPSSPLPGLTAAAALLAPRTTATTTTKHHAARTRQSGNSRAPGQFLCEHIVDPATKRICGQTFRRSYDLSRHQSIHLKNRPFCYCAQCGKKFTRMDALRRHERVQGHTAAARRHTRQHLALDRTQQARV